MVLKMMQNFLTTNKTLQTPSEKHGEKQDEQQQQQQQREKQEQQQHGQEQRKAAEEVKLESLQDEIRDMIVNLSIRGHNQTIVYTYNALSQTSTKFKRLVSRYLRRLPKIGANRDMDRGLHSMRHILKQYGRGSGLVLALKKTHKQSVLSG